MGRASYLTIDFNSFFASVEQEMNPSLRGKPIAVVPVMSDTTSAIAASYEAKAFGVKTGTRIWEAKRMCPGLVLVPARHELYVEMHERLKEEVQNHVPLFSTGSIDEFTCRLIGDECEAGKARRIALSMKAGIRKNVGQCLNSSIGIAPTRLLSKIASDMQKPNGLTLIEQKDLPHILHPLALTDLPGIASNMEARLHRAGITSVGQLLALEPKAARLVWGSVGGERYWYELHGVDVPRTEDGRRSVGHSRVLAPRLRGKDDARFVARSLLLKCATRIRRYQQVAGGFGLAVHPEYGTREPVVHESRIAPTQDSFTLLGHLDQFWNQLPARSGPFRKVSVWLYRLSDEGARARDLFVETRPDGFTKKEMLWRSVDRLVARYGRESVTLASQKNLGLHYLGAKIAFTRVPDAQEFRE